MGQVDLEGRSQSSPMPWSKRLAFKDNLPPLRTLSLVRLRYTHPHFVQPCMPCARCHHILKAVGVYSSCSAQSGVVSHPSCGPTRQ